MSANASVLTFEDRPAPAFFTSEYHGFNFGDNNPATNPWFSTNQTSPFYTPRSPTHYIATDSSLYDNSNPSQATQAITSATAFIFNGAYFSGSDSIYYQLYLNNQLVDTTSPSSALTSVPQFVATDYFGLVDSVVVFGRQGYYALDDFTYNVEAAPPSSSVPEPASYGLALTALCVARLVRRARPGSR